MDLKMKQTVATTQRGLGEMDKVPLATLRRPELARPLWQITRSISRWAPRSWT